MLRRAIVTTAMLASTAAFAQGADGGPAPSQCGATLTDDGACYGDVAAWCEEQNAGGVNADAGVTTLDCASLELDEAPIGGTCAVLEDVGAWCGVPSGAPCALPGSDGVVQLACLSGGALDVNAACDLDRGCVSGTACSSDGPACEGDRLRLSCAPFGQALLLDCPSFEGRCADGLVCLGAERGLGICLPQADPSSPVEPPEDDPPPPPAGCTATHSTGSSTPAGWLALLGLLAIVRRAPSKRSIDRYRATFPG